MNFKDIFNNAYGWDKYSKTLSIMGLIFLLSKWGIIVGIALIFYATWRALSKNKYVRYKEEMVFESFLNSIRYYLIKFKNSVTGFFQKLKSKKDYMIVSCPNCSQKLRLPRHKGKIIVCCKKCNHEFKIKS